MQKTDAEDTDLRRTELRAQLIAARQVLANRAEAERVLAARVARWLRTMPVTRLAFFWPIRGEPDLTGTIAAWLAEDAQRRAALPVIAGDLLEFAPWAPDTPMRVGAYGIREPARHARINPQLLLIPCVGVDSQRYRLGYGGGYYDRTLARLDPRPVTVGIAFECGRVNTIGPQPHDIRLDLVITEAGVL
ncbi:MAG: 5-formyltetrahydrofolate cyclo-ligase [Burkholderiaceae bacterium]|nr:5-formyltetrahydrofolate cyclo-ligase [Burkholderiaceae bacterium]